MKHAKCLPLLLAGALLLTGCGRTVSDTTIPVSEDQGLVHGAREGLSYSTYCVTDGGIVFGRGNVIRYYDLDTDMDYVLCDRANCTHKNASCNAWYEDKLTTNGIAIYGDAVYYLTTNASSNEYRLITMDLSGNNKRTVARFDIGDYEIGSWYIGGVDDVYYRNGYAWIAWEYLYVRDESYSYGYTEWSGVQLSTGKKITLNELTTDGTECEIDAILDDTLILSRRVSSMEELSEEDFYEALGEGDFGTEFDDSDDPDYDYVWKWYPAHNEMTDTIIRYDIETGEETVLEETPVEVSFNEDGTMLGTMPKYLFYGDYNGRLICEEMGEGMNDAGARFFLWDMEDNSQEDFLTIPDSGGGSLAWEDGSVHSQLYDGHYLVYLLNTDDDDIHELYLFDFETMESRKLTEYKADDALRIIGQTEDTLVGVVYGDLVDSIYKISKTDYGNGALKKKTLLLI